MLILILKLILITDHFFQALLKFVARLRSLETSVNKMIRFPLFGQKNIISISTSRSYNEFKKRFIEMRMEEHFPIKCSVTNR